MTDKQRVYLGMFLGSLIGGYLPVIFGVDAFSLWSIVGSIIGGLIGIYVFYKMGSGY